MPVQDSSIDSLAAALRELARLGAAPVEDARLAEALQEHGAGGGADAGLDRLAEHLGWGCVPVQSPPDPLLLPLLCFCPGLGWAVLVASTPAGDWRVRLDGRERDLPAADVTGPCYRLVPSRAGPERDPRPDFRGLLRQTLGRYRKVIAEAVAASVFINVLAVATSFYALQVYDKVIPTRSGETLVALSAGVLLFIAMEWLMKLSRSRIMERVLVGADRELGRGIFERLLAVRLDQLPGSVGSLAAQVRGYEQVRAFYTATTLFSLVDIPSAIIFVVLISVIASPVIALVPFTLSLLAITAGLLAARRIDRLALAGAAAGHRKTGLLVETVEGAETIKVGNGSWSFLRRWVDNSEEALEADVRLKGTQDLLKFSAATLQQSGYVLTVLLGAILVMRADMTMGALIATSILGGRVLAAIMALPNLIVQRANARSALEGIERLYALERDNEGVKRPLVPVRVSGALRLERVAFRYDDSGEALRLERPLAVEPGERIGIVGPIGSGKSTLLKLMAGLYQPQEGRVLLDGLDVRQVSRVSLAQGLGYLAQDQRLFQGTLRDNLLIGLPEPPEEKLLKVLRATGLDQVVAAHPEGLDRPIVEGGRGLSGGQRQLLGFSRLFLRYYPVLLLDEPTSSMDEQLEQRCLDLLSRKVLGERTLVLATHKASLLKLVDRLWVVHEGRVLLDGPRDEVLARLRGPDDVRKAG